MLKKNRKMKHSHVLKVKRKRAKKIIHKKHRRMPNLDDMDDMNDMNDMNNINDMKQLEYDSPDGRIDMPAPVDMPEPAKMPKKVTTDDTNFQLPESNPLYRIFRDYGINLPNTIGELKRAFRRAIRELHPDKNMYATEENKLILAEKLHLLIKEFEELKEEYNFTGLRVRRVKKMQRR
jgi:hypothetical protein